MEHADLVVIGSGQGGVPLAVDYAREGQRVFLFERGAVGGSCVNYGCIPSKVFLASAHAAGRARHAGPLGVPAQVEVDFGAVMERVRSISRSSRDNTENELEQAGVRVVDAEASFVAERTVSGGELTVEAERVVIDTGASATIPSLEGLAGTPFLTYENFWNQQELPRRAVVIGSGFVGLELGQGWARLGAEVAIVEEADRIAPEEEPEVGAALRSALEEDGITFHTGTQAQGVEYESNRFLVTLSSGVKLEGDGLLVSTGRRPNTGALRPAAAGIALDDEGYVKVNEHFETTSRGVYAIGDVSGHPAFTHVSWEDYRRLKTIWESGERKLGDRVLGYAVFTDPQVGRSGLTLQEAKSRGINAEAVTMPLDEVGRARHTGQTTGFYRMVVNRENDKILGATLVSPAAAELVHVFLDLIEAGATWQLLERAQHIHPTFAEGLPSLARKLKER